ncbi:cell envelope integrity protein CreD [Pontixanthobacter aestiaquae]|uniref:Cell envelope integrity protein CreD n=1 Tax=Pontixanthobacter aestiaquae TaxID=1509367 RepID=A0A844Z9T7_9SPHN|nr:cell envelope integrity protein CreD [Pontixanthobacter aestiaquae]MDN3645225.1 cell envelope integrity protein CreD [Pontixanthobacter aestiaquae]MXO83773.1 cell envelope integrity protein CreD [Pontixanthobacter aestiaquae]
MKRDRSPGVKLFLAAAIGAVLLVPLIMVYALVSDREAQSRTAQASITAGWGGEQTVTGPVLVIPYNSRSVQTETVDGKQVTRAIDVRRELFLSPLKQSIETDLQPDVKQYSIYRSVIYRSDMTGTASFVLPSDLDRGGVTRDQLLFDQAELRFGVSDPRGLTDGTTVRVGNEVQELHPGNGPASTNGSGFSTAVEWDGTEALAVNWQYGLRGSRSIALIPRGGETEWTVTSPWQHPSFKGDFLPDNRGEEADNTEGFTANYGGITNLALGESLVNLSDAPAPIVDDIHGRTVIDYAPAVSERASTKYASIRLIEPVDLYSQVDRSVKYGFLFIGFTFACFFMFDVVAGARVAAAEYLLTGIGLVLFFVMLLAFAEVIGFAWAYIVASFAMIGLLTSYSAAVLGGWRRAAMIGGMLTGLYITLYVLLSLEAWSLMIGSVLLFVALAAVMYATRNIDWSGLTGQDNEESFAEAS